VLSYSFWSRRRVLHVMCAARASPVDPHVTLAGFLSLALECPWTLDAEMIYVRDVFGRTRRWGLDWGGGLGFSTPRPPVGRHYFRAKGDRVIGGG